jgi:hypothetical protein
MKTITISFTFSKKDEADFNESLGEFYHRLSMDGIPFTTALEADRDVTENEIKIYKECYCEGVCCGCGVAIPNDGELFCDSCYARDQRKKQDEENEEE